MAREIAALEGFPRMQGLPDLRGQEIEHYYAEGVPSEKTCIAPFQAAVVKPNGDVRFCPDEWIDDYVLGNILEERFLKIWRNRKARRFRAVLLRKKSFPGCKRCSWMHCL